MNYCDKPLVGFTEAFFVVAFIVLMTSIFAYFESSASVKIHNSRPTPGAEVASRLSTTEPKRLYYIGKVGADRYELSIQDDSKLHVKRKLVVAAFEPFNFAGDVFIVFKDEKNQIRIGRKVE